MTPNRATIYSNGIAELVRVYAVTQKKPAKISIPVRQQHLADVLASLTVSGEVKMVTPPSFQPANLDDGNLSIPQGNVLVGLAHQLSGAMVSVSHGGEKVTGQLIGTQSQQVGGSGEPFTEIHLVILAKGGMHRIALNDVMELKFTDQGIQAEINKALSRQIQEIKPNSTFVDLVLSSDQKQADATVQYTIPAAAWKISYRIILLDDKKVELQGHAIVDNNTDEDWKDFMVSVVMGQPITFTSDLADSKTPYRSHVNIVQQSAVGAVEVEESMMVFAGAVGSSDDEFSREAAPPAGAKSSRGRMRSMKQAMAPAPAAAMPSKLAQAEVTEAGDFCIFQSPHPVSIDARRSAVIPVFQTALEESASVLHFKKENHRDRPFRSIRLKNTTEHSLGRGICTVLDHSTYAGSCIVPAMKPGGDSLLPHALETGVKVVEKMKPKVSRRIGIRVSEGVVVESHHNQAQTDYQIKNSTGSSLPFILDHDLVIGASKVEARLIRVDQTAVSLSAEELSRGVRLNFDLLPQDEMVISIVESKVQTSRIRLVGSSIDHEFQIHWLYDNFVDADTPLLDDEHVKRCIGLQRDLDDVDLQIRHAEAEVKRLMARQERLRKNIKTGGGESQNQKWQLDLGKSEDAIVQLEEHRVPELQGERTRIRQRLFDALNSLVLEWSE